MMLHFIDIPKIYFISVEMNGRGNVKMRRFVYLNCD